MLSSVSSHVRSYAVAVWHGDPETNLSSVRRSAPPAVNDTFARIMCCYVSQFTHYIQTEAGAGSTDGAHQAALQEPCTAVRGRHTPERRCRLQPQAYGGAGYRYISASSLASHMGAQASTLSGRRWSSTCLQSIPICPCSPCGVTLTHCINTFTLISMSRDLRNHLISFDSLSTAAKRIGLQHAINIDPQYKSRVCSQYFLHLAPC